jgi:hypothetical protein
MPCRRTGLQRTTTWEVFVAPVRTWFLTLLIVLGACGQTPSTPTAAVGTPDVGSQPEVFGVFTHVDGQAESTGETLGTTGSGCEFSSSPAAGDPGAPCATASDCQSSLCVEGPTGKICTRTCVDCCPSGFQCGQSGTGDALFVCIPRLTALCRPCLDDGECAKVNQGSLCIGYGGAGRFCGGSCDKDGDCTAGYACQDTQGTAGAGKQCVRTSGECGCSARSVTDGASTTCFVQNGAGSCTGSRKCTPAGLSACDAATPATETCNGADDDCNGATDEPGAVGCTVQYPDADGDGVGAGAGSCTCKPAGSAPTAGDCDDGNAQVHAGAQEVCNGLDDDCNGATDDGFPDTDKDGVADCLDPDDDGDGTLDAQDCAPLDPAISPSATEACNGQDDDCDGQTDEAGAQGCTDWFVDADGDGEGQLGSVAQCACKAVDLFTSASATDCDDGNKAVHASATEACNDVDDDCDGLVDEGCDDDKDGYCDVAMVVTGEPVVCPKGKKDCDDANVAVHPGQPEVCDDGLDDDCDGTTDAGEGALGCTVFFADQDKDGFGVAQSKCLCASTEAYSAGNAKDCNDADPVVNPATQEVCGNGKDDNCSGKMDEEDAIGCEAYYQDLDGDGAGAGGSLCLCGPDVKYTTKKSGDCDDSNAKVGPGAVEVCNGADDNCNGATDEQDAQGCTKYFADGDKDGFGDPDKAACLCAPAGAFTVAIAGDCDDTSATANPAAKEACNGVDDNCSGSVDEAGASGCTAYYQDGDADGYGDPGKSACLCVQVAPYKVSKGGDCDDGATEIHPGAAEVCDGVDNNCSGAIDEAGAVGCFPYLRDEDGDGYGLTGVTKCQCKPTAPYSATQGGDCDDGKSAVSPKAAEACNGLDDNCDGITDNQGADGCSPFFVDKDGDGFGSYFTAPKCLCGPVTPYVAPAGGDCDDNDGTSYPKAQEVCDGKDNDCDGIIDQKGAKGCKTYYADGDGDGFGISNLSQCTCKADSYFTALQGGDCDDQTKTVNPGASEVCNGVDDNCNGVTDGDAPQAKVFYADGDGDGFGTGSGKTQCSAGGGYTATQAGDCNDGDSGTFPGATEVCDGKDNNCNGAIDDGTAGLKTWYYDGDGDGWGTSLSKLACSGAAPYTATKAGDCSDGDAGVNPGASEIQCNGKDENCDGADACTGCGHDKCASGTALANGCEACVTSICKADSFCCNNSWDSICVGEVQSVCGSYKCAASAGSCGHPLCTVGAKVTAGCDTGGCATKVCAADSFCCNVSWDSLCVNEVTSVCAKSCN